MRSMLEDGVSIETVGKMFGHHPVIAQEIVNWHKKLYPEGAPYPSADLPAWNAQPPEDPVNDSTGNPQITLEWLEEPDDDDEDEDED